MNTLKVSSEFDTLLTSEQLESLRQASNAEKMRPGQFDVLNWREIPTTQDEFDQLTADDQAYWLYIATTF